MFSRFLLVVPVLALSVAWADPEASRKPAPPSPEQLYQARLREASNTVPGHAALARWCHSQGLDAHAREQWLTVIGLDPEFAEARESLGYRKVAGVWMSEADYKAYQERQAKQNSSHEITEASTVVEGRATGWTADHTRLIVEAARAGAVDLHTRYIRVGIPLVTLELRPTMAQLMQMRTVFTSGAVTGAGPNGNTQSNIFVEAPITQLTSVRTTAMLGAYR